MKFYRAVHTSKSPTGLADAFRTVLGTTEQQFTADWQQYLEEARRCLSRTAKTAPRGGRVSWLAAALVVVIVTTTPWHLIDLPTPDAALDFTTAEIDRQNQFRPRAVALVNDLVGAVGAGPAGDRLQPARPPPVRRDQTAPLVLRRPGGGGRAGAAGERDHAADGRAWRNGCTRNYGLSTESWGSWLRDRAVNWVLDVARAGRDRARPDRLRQDAGGRGGGHRRQSPAAVLVLGVSFAYPVLVEPRFNDFTSMAPGPQRDEFMQLAAEDGVPVKDVLVADASKRTTALNAYVSGLRIHPAAGRLRHAAEERAAGAGAAGGRARARPRRRGRRPARHADRRARRRLRGGPAEVAARGPDGRSAPDRPAARPDRGRDDARRAGAEPGQSPASRHGPTTTRSSSRRTRRTSSRCSTSCR